MTARRKSLNLCYAWCRGALERTGHQGVYLKPNKRIHPEIYHLKEVMKRAPGGVEIFIESCPSMCPSVAS